MNALGHGVGGDYEVFQAACASAVYASAVCPIAVCPIAVCPIAVCPIAVCPIVGCPIVVYAEDGGVVADADYYVV
jgi:hypothetical protein